MTEDQLLDAIFEREGDDYADQTTTPPTDQPTGRGGIILATLRQYLAETLDRQLEGTVEQLKRLTHEQARVIVRWKVRRLAQESGLSKIDYEPLRLQLLDFAYNSGTPLAIRWLQRVLGVPRTGVMDPTTVAAAKYPDFKRIPIWLNESLVAARLRMIDMWSDPDPHRPKDINQTRKALEEGVESRALRFSLLEVP